jgi:hypothetical protein
MPSAPAKTAASASSLPAPTMDKAWLASADTRQERDLLQREIFADERD